MRFSNNQQKWKWIAYLLSILNLFLYLENISWKSNIDLTLDRVLAITRILGTYTLYILF